MVGHDEALWFGTNQGVARFDGNAFQRFGAEKGLTDLSVVDLLEDDQQRLWCRTSHQQIFVLESDSFRLVDMGWKQAVASPDAAISSWLVRGDTAWVAWAPGGLWHATGIHSTTEKPNLERIATGSQNYLYECGIGQFLDGGVAPDTGLSLSITRIGDPSQVLDLAPIDTFQSGNFTALPVQENWLMAFQNKLFLHQPDSGSKENCAFRNTHVKAALFQDRKHLIWVGTVGDGAYVIDPDSDYSIVGNYLPGKTVTAIAQDYEGGYWFATLNDGVYYASAPFTVDHLTVLNGNRITAQDVFDFQGALYARTIPVYFFRLQLEKNGDFKYDPIKLPVNKTIHSQRVVGDYLYYSSIQGFYRMDNDHQSTKVAHGWGKYMVVDSTGMYLLSNRLEFLAHGKAPTEEEILLEDFCQPVSIEKEQDNSLYVGCNDAIRRIFIDKENDTVQVDTLWEGRGVAFTLLTKHWLLATINRKGLLMFDRRRMMKGESPDPVTLALDESLGAKSLGRMYQTLDDDLWVSSDVGLLRFQYTDDTFQLKKIYQTKEGFPPNNFVLNMHEFEGRLWLATSAGLYSTPIYEEELPTVTPKMNISRMTLQQDGEELETDSKNLSHTDNNIHFYFAGTTFANAGDIPYRYRLLGLDSTFQETKDQQAFFPALPPNSYTFEVAAANSKGQWSETPARYTFTVLPPFWKTWWFYALEALAVIAVLYGISWFRNRVRKEQQELKMAMVESRQKALSAQINPHFLYNSLNSAQYYIIDDDPRSAANHLERFSDLMLRVFQNTSVTEVTLEEELAILKLYMELEQERFEHAFTFSIEVDDALSASQIMIPTMLLQPHAENAIWHGLIRSKKKGGHVNIIARKKENGFLLLVEDNGIGRKKSKNLKQASEYQSTGIQITLERIELLNRKKQGGYAMEIIDLQTADGQAAGTRVELSFPLELPAFS